MRAFMSTYSRRRTAVNDGFASDRDAFVGMAEREARRILAETEPTTPDWWRQPVYQVRPIRIAGVPCSSQITLRDMPAWSALAEALAAFVGEEGL